MQRIYRSFLSPRDLRGSAVLTAVLGVMFLLVGVVAGSLFLYDAFVEHLSLRDWFSGWDWLFLLGLLLGPLGFLSSRSRSRRALSLRRIEAGGVPAWARVTRIRQAAESMGRRQFYYLHLQVQAEDGSAFESTAFDVLPIADSRLHAWTEVYQLSFPVLLDPRNRGSAKILWNDPRVRWSSSGD